MSVIMPPPRAHQRSCVVTPARRYNHNKRRPAIKAARRVAAVPKRRPGRRCEQGGATAIGGGISQAASRAGAIGINLEDGTPPLRELEAAGVARVSVASGPALAVMSLTQR
jgi:hypothetical protein